MSEHLDMVTPVYTAETARFYGEVLRHKHHHYVYGCIYSKPRPEPQDDDGRNLIASVPFEGLSDASGWLDEELARMEGRGDGQ